MADQTPVIDVENLVVEYGKGDKATRAVNGITFRVEPGETVGFIGANGAGKSTTMKTLMGFLFPTSGTARVFGLPAGNAQSREKIGYLPEVALYYPFMKARELLELYGGLSGMKRSELRARIPRVLERVGLGGKEESLLRSFSKGMQQRLGIAQSLIAEPEALIFDELSSGLDPVGRYDLRDVLLELKKEGRTVFFSSHELTEVESLCDRVIVIHEGNIVKQAPLDELMKPLNQFEVTFRSENGSLPDEVARFEPINEGNYSRVVVNDVGDYTKILTALQNAGIEIQETSSKTRSLEEYFIEIVRGSSEDAS